MKSEDLRELKRFLSTLDDEELKQRALYLKDLASGKIEGPLVGYPSIDQPWLPSYSDEKITYTFPEKSIYQLIYDNLSMKKDQVAFDIRSSANGFTKGIKVTYGQFLKNINRIAKSLSVIGTKEDEIVPIILPNVKEARELIYANSVVGSTSYPISPLLAVNQLESIIKENSVKTVFIFKAFYPKYRKALENSNIEHIVYLDGTEMFPLFFKLAKKIEKLAKHEDNEVDRIIESDKRIMSWDDFCSCGKKIQGDLVPHYKKDHVAVIIGTSGTTGTPKGVCLTDENVNAVAISYINGEYFEGNFMDALLPSIGYGISMIHYQAASGRYVYLIPELLTTKFPEAVEKLKPDNFPGGPVHYINLIKSNLCEKQDFQVENFISGGASLPRSVEKGLNKVDEDYEERGGSNSDLKVRQGFGLSENAAVGAYNKRGWYKFGSIGIPIIYENVGIFEPGTDRELPYNEQGEICITGPTVMKEYLNNQKETDAVIKVHADGERWIHTKDIGYIDETGHIYHVDRIKNIFMRTGFNVHPAQIAEFLNELPFVVNSAVIGFEHPEEQAVPVAFVQIDESQRNHRTDEDLRSVLLSKSTENLEQPSVPVDFVFVDELPINAGGKIDQGLIRKQADIDFDRDHGKVLKKSLSFREK